MNKEFVAKKLYEAYCNHTDWKSLISGQALPPWDILREDVKQAWVAVASEAATLDYRLYYE